MAEHTYYVAVDFGSESMAACFIESCIPDDPRDVDLQTRGPADCELLQEPSGTQSKRLRTRIGLNNKNVDDEFLAQQKIVDLSSSVFEFFHLPFQEYGRPLLPNLKLLYQSAVRELLPEEARKSTPERILATVILQILNNLVFQDPKLLEYADAHSGGLKGSRIHLILTVPNVYSVSHAGKLRQFIEEELSVGGERLTSVQTMYESDALANYLMYARNVPQEAMQGALAKIRLARDKGTALNVLTIDIGRGTTDISFATYRFRASDEVWLYDLKARTGRTHGGGRLTYLIAKALDDKLKAVYDAWLASLTGNPAKFAAENRIRITSRALAGVLAEGALLSTIERYIEEVKSNWDENLVLRDWQKASEQHLGQRLKEELLRYFKDDVPAADVEKLHAAILGAFTIPEKLPRRRAPFWGWRALQAAIRTVRKANVPLAKPGDVDDRFAMLAEEIEQYVAANSRETLAWMVEMVAATENVRRFRGLLQNTETIVMIGGQAAQFEPLRAALKDHIQSWNVNVQNIVSLSGTEAKYSCCHGAVMRHRINIENLRTDRVMGTYGFLGADAGRPLTFIDMQKFHDPDQEQSVPLSNAYHYFVYLPRYFKDGGIKGKEVDRLITEGGALAYLWPIPKGGAVLVKNLGVGGIRLRYQDKEQQEEITDNAAFGDVAVPGEHMWSRTWPEILRPLK